jgi:hypothetical protein
MHPLETADSTGPSVAVAAHGKELIVTSKPNGQGLGRSVVRKQEQDLELWKHHATFGGEDKNRMVVIASWLLGFSAVILAQVEYHLDDFGRLTLNQPERAAPYAAIGAIVSITTAFVALVYGGYANRNWYKADEIASSEEWTDLLPPEAATEALKAPWYRRRLIRRSWSRSLLPHSQVRHGKTTDISWRRRSPNTWAWLLARPCDPTKDLAPVFKLFLSLASGSLLLHIGVIVWSLVLLSRM